MLKSQHISCVFFNVCVCVLRIVTQREGPLVKNHGGGVEPFLLCFYLWKYMETVGFVWIFSSCNCTIDFVLDEYGVRAKEISFLVLSEIIR